MTAPVIFLDIDGVLNSQRSCAALSGFPRPTDPASWDLFDPVAVRLLRRVVRKTGAVCVLSSTWRSIKSALLPLTTFLEVPIIGRTRPTLSRELRGEQIRDWLVVHPEVDRWAIVDDDSDMLPEQMERFVKVDGNEGLSYHQHLRLIDLLGGERRG